MRHQVPKAFAPLFEPAPYKAFYGGRGSAKSHSCAAALVTIMSEQPLRWLCAREIQKSLKQSVHQLIKNKIRDLGVTDMWTAVESEIRCVNGSVFLFEGLRTNPDGVQSLEGLNGAWIEEAQRASQRSLTILEPTLREPWPDGREPELWATWNPNSPTDPIDNMFRGNHPTEPAMRPPGAVVREVNYDENPFLPTGLRDKMEWAKETDPEKYAHVWLGRYLSRSSARVFHNWRVEECPEPAHDTRFLFGADWGFSVDPTVLVRCWIDPDNPRRLYVDREAWEVGCEVEDTPALFDTIDDGQARRWPICADSARPETVSHVKRHGFPQIFGAKKGPGSVEDGVEFLKGFEIVVDPGCKHVADEMACYRYKVDSMTEKVLPLLEDKKNHTIDSLRYAVEGERRGPPSGWSVYSITRESGNIPE